MWWSDVIVDGRRRRVRFHDDHDYVLTENEVLRWLPKIIYHLESYDQDLVRSTIPTYFTARLASEYVKVILTGEGADELFAGYQYHQKIDNAGALQEELRRSIASLHNINLQRVDRLTMAHSVEARVPFLDVSMIALAQRIPVDGKLYRPASGGCVEKWILRKACEDRLPPEIVWRDKEQFDEGSGTADFVGSHGLTQWLDRSEAEPYVSRHRADRLRSPEECVYHKIFVDSFADAGFMLRNVARWSAEQPNSQLA